MDIAFALVLATIAVVNVVQEERPIGGRIGIVCAALALTLPLALRRRHALIAALVMTTALVVQSVATDPPEAIWTLVAVIVMAYSTGAYERLRGSLLGAGALAVGLPLSVALDPSDTSGNIAPTLLIFVGIPWIAGRLSHRDQRHSAALSEQVSLLEREQELLARQAVSEERARIARELHDVVAHSVSVIAIQADAAEALLDRDPALAREPLGIVKRSARESLSEMRHLLDLLREADEGLALEPQPGLGDVDALVEKVRSAGLAVELTVEGEQRPIPSGVDLSAYRIVQEGLTNALKHAGPTHVHISLTYAPGAIQIEILDDGPENGQPALATHGGHGLVGMRERVALYGGELEARARHEGGFALRAAFPLETSLT